jgi:hypothetical protein
VRPRCIAVKLAYGDVRILRISRVRDAFRIAIYDDDAATPLIQAQLNEAERQAICKALAPDK